MSKKPNWFAALVVRYLRHRYGGNVDALKPPLGYSKYLPRPFWYRIVYRCWLKPRWLVERWLFNRYGQPMRDAWRNAMRRTPPIEVLIKEILRLQAIDQEMDAP